MKERLCEFLAYLGIGQTKFEENVGLSRGFVHRLTGNLTLKTLDKILAKYPELNEDWLKTGEGEMLKKNEVVEQKNESENEIIFTLIEKNEKLNQEIGALRNENQNLKSKIDEYELIRKKTVDMGVDSKQVANE
ncbi:MAG: hypothetical protein LBG17_05065 [Bacteroidales bacterium]|nr:hypothetical protein [Bacteroidales bacterium]